MSTRHNIETITYRGETIEIWRDDCPCNPFEDWCCLPPLLVNFDGRTYKYGADDVVPTLNRAQILNNLPEITNLLQYPSNKAMLRDAFDYNELCEAGVNYMLEQAQHYDYNFGLEELAEVYTMAGITCLYQTVRGYSQGDWAECLAIATPEYLKEIGRESIEPKDLQSDIDLYEAWAFGDVYGFTIESAEDSCGGFYGADHDASGLLENAKSSVDCYLQGKREARAAKLKQLIRAHVPFGLRANLLG